jgi:phosphonate transport system substrate-binding protein
MSKKLLIILLCVIIVAGAVVAVVLLTQKPVEKAAKMDKLTLEFVPSKDADVIITGTANLPELLKAEMLKQGYDIGEVDITVGTSYEATGEAMAAGAIDIGWLPGGTYALFSDEVDVILTATRAGLSNDSTDSKTWNGLANKTLPTDEQVTFYRSLIYATPSAYGKELAAKVNAGEALTWEDLDKASWGVMKTSSSAGYIYPTLWLMANYDGKKLTDLSKVVTLSGYGEAFAQAAAEAIDITVCYADGRRDYEDAWILPTTDKDATGKAGMGRTVDIWDEMNVIGVTEGIYNDTVSITKANPAVYNPEFITAIQNALINLINTDEGKAIFSVYSHTGYALATDADYEGARKALAAVE